MGNVQLSRIGELGPPTCKRRAEREKAAEKSAFLNSFLGVFISNKY